MVDPTAQIAAGARIHPDAKIGPWCIIGPGAEVGPGAVLGDRVALAGRVRVGARARLARGATVGPPQHLAHLDTDHATNIGDGAILREFVTVHGSTGPEPTLVGEGAFLMALCHVGHDCQVGAGAVLTNLVQLAGHVRIGPHAVLGGGAMVHQRLEVGEYAMVGGMSAVRASVPPYSLVAGDGGGCWVRGPNRVPFRDNRERRARVVAALAAWRQAPDREEALAALDGLATPEARTLADFLRRWPSPCRWQA